MLCPVCQTPNPDDALTCRACGSPLEPVDAPASSGEVTLSARTPLYRGAFVLEELLGAGGFGLTYRAREVALGRTVAIKEFFPFGSTRDGLAVRPPAGVSQDEWQSSLDAFRQEALSLARFNHPAIVRAYAVWGENGTAYFAMEFLRGQSLQKRLDGGKPMPLDEALGVVESIGAALEQVHEAGFLHRDIKPDNILLCDGRAVLIDFGTARAFASDKTTPMTQLLTPGYAPLEQYGRRARFGAYTDVYALAATLYHALSGHAPAPATDRATGVELRPLDELSLSVSPRLARAVEAALEISVPKRPPTVAAWLELLRDAQKPPNAPPLPTPPPTGTPSPFLPPKPSPRTSASSVPPPQTATLAPDQVQAASPSMAPRPIGPRPLAPRREASASDVPFVPDIAPEARVPRWVVPALVIVPLLALGFWWNYDPARSDLSEFDERLRPILRLRVGAKSVFSSLDHSSAESFASDVQERALPPQQAVVDKLESLAPHSDEALYSRDQLLDAEQDHLEALRNLGHAREESEQKSAIDELRRADEEFQTWRDDYAFLLQQHGVSD
jgi:serine/threonine protein kinase